MSEKLQQVFLMGVSIHLVAQGGDVLAKLQAIAALRYPSLASFPPSRTHRHSCSGPALLEASWEHRLEAPKDPDL